MRETILTGDAPRVAIVTGGTRGIGRQVAVRLAEAGHAVVLSYLQDVAEADDTVAALKEAGATVLAVKGDIGEERAVASLFATAEKAFGGIDVVVNAAGIIGVTGPAADYDLDLFDSILRTNIRGTFLVAQQAARRLRRGGALVTVSSSATRLSRPGSAAYTMSKGAVEALALLLARELRGRDITVNTVAPGVVGTDLFERFLAGRPEVRAELIAASPMDRLGLPDDIAGVVAFLAGPQARWINGQVIYVNGGAA